MVRPDEGCPRPRRGAGTEETPPLKGKREEEERCTTEFFFRKGYRCKEKRKKIPFKRVPPIVDQM
jgi:hypothetical protein